MWFFPRQLLSNVFQRDRGDEADAVEGAFIGELLISILGLYVLSYAIPDMIFHLVLLITLDDYFDIMLPNDHASFITGVSRTFSACLPNALPFDVHLCWR